MDEHKQRIKNERDEYLKQYERAYKELQKECNELKELIDTVDPLNIDFDAKTNQINNLKHICNNLHYRIVKREFL